MQSVVARDVMARIFPAVLADRLAPAAGVMTAKGGRILLSVGSTSDSVYIVARGRVQVTLYSIGGREVILRDLGEDAMFGEIAVLDGAPRSASVVALTDCQLVAIDAAAFRSAVSEIPEAALWLARRLAGQIRALTERVFELNALPVRSRLHCELLRMCVADAAGAEAKIDPAPTHAAIAARIGTHREAVTRELRYLAQQGMIRQDRRSITVTDPPALALLVQHAVGDDAPEAPPLNRSG
ncbi:Crp/Fnr family transcriptional regulator [Sphingomonas sp. RS6]